MNQLQLFTQARRPKRVRMHIIDAGDGIASFKCRKCSHKTGWITATHSEIRKGIVCPICEQQPTTANPMASENTGPYCQITTLEMLSRLVAKDDARPGRGIPNTEFFRPADIDYLTKHGLAEASSGWIWPTQLGKQTVEQLRQHLAKLCA